MLLVYNLYSDPLLSGFLASRVAEDMDPEQLR